MKRANCIDAVYLDRIVFTSEMIGLNLLKSILPKSRRFFVARRQIKWAAPSRFELMPKMVLCQMDWIMNSLKKDDLATQGIPFNVLAIDGGGIRGLYTAALLQSLARHFCKIPLGEDVILGPKFSLISGTSTGGILACGLAAKKSTQTMVQLYEMMGPKVFTDPQPNGKMKLFWWARRNFFKAANSSAPLRECLTEMFGDKTLGAIFIESGIALCLPACRMLDFSPKVFKTPHSDLYTRDQHVTVVDACLATSAAPIFLPIASVKEAPDQAPSAFVDGGLWANNPTLVAVLEAIELCSDPKTGRLSRPIRVLSVGTSGGASGNEPGSNCNRGLLGWKFGGEAAGVSIEVQGMGTHHIVLRYIRWLRKLGFDIEYGRIANPSISDKQAAELYLDRATPAALKLLRELGDKRAQDIQSEAANGTDLGNLVREVFGKNDA